jgi:hypothetical protein
MAGQTAFQVGAFQANAFQFGAIGPIIIPDQDTGSGGVNAYDPSAIHAFQKRQEEIDRRKRRDDESRKTLVTRAFKGEPLDDAIEEPKLLDALAAEMPADVQNIIQPPRLDFTSVAEELLGRPALKQRQDEAMTLLLLSL